MLTELTPHIPPPIETGPLGGEPDIHIDVPSANLLVVESLALAVPHFARKGAPPDTVIRSTPEQRNTARKTEVKIEQRKILKGGSK